ncbi:beta-C integrin subunit, partial [Apostichopus japonicus]
RVAFAVRESGQGISKMRWLGVYFIGICLSSILISSTSAQSALGSCSVAKTCGECLVRSPECAWCKSENFAEVENFPRCDLKSNLLDRLCLEEDIVNPENEATTTGDSPLTEPDSGTPVDELVQVFPQAISLKLRPGKTETITMDILQAEDFPVDLYYLMDLSDSMKDDLVSLRTLGALLAAEMQNITSNFRLGYGAFVDKKVVPYVEITPARLLNPCGPSATCEPPFGFHNVLPLTEQTERFSQEVGVVKSSGNLDNPEGGLDALLQATVCSEQIGWRERARHMLLFSTDSPFHIAGDGKLGGIVMPNDGLCHTDSVSGLYTEATTQDYPSISQLSAMMEENRILPVFAIGKASATAQDPYVYYEQLKDFFHEAYAERLTQNSSNVVQIVKDVYASITSGVKLEDDADKEVIDVGYTSYCLGAAPQKGVSGCEGLRLGDKVQFALDITLKNTSCDGDKRTFSFKVGPTAFAENLEVTIEALCDCDCSDNTIVSPDYCSNGNGSLVCGACTCFEGRSGRLCECDRDEAEGVDEACVAPDSEEKLECSGRGTCVCGRCECDYRANTREEISGPYCECDNFSCERYKGEICGGPTRGQCVCNETSWRSECVCNEGYINSNCNCSLSTDTCIAPNGRLCNDEGDCECGACTCRNPEKFSGATCQLCKDCPSECEINEPCVQCKAFGTGPYDDKQCDACPHPIVVVEELSDREGSETCVFTDDDDCSVYFTHEILPNGTYYIEVKEEKECPGTPEILWIILGIILGIIFVGLALLLIWRLLALIHDRNEFDRFEKERTTVQWEAGENPIYRPSTTVFKNPTYGK